MNNLCENTYKESKDQKERKLSNLAIINFSEIKMFSKEFVIEYNHYDSK